MRILIGIAGLLAMALGVLWLLQGLGLVHLRPILCLANCEVLQGPSAVWAIVGIVTVGAGAWGASYGFMGRRA
jgi:hypothetical protein